MDSIITIKSIFSFLDFTCDSAVKYLDLDLSVETI